MDIKPFNSDVGTALVNRISDAIGTLYEPHRIVKKAEAEAKASIIQKEADIKCSELQQRAMQRWIHEETRKQANIESIQEKAIPLLKDDAKPHEMEEDWIAHFFEKSRSISDTEMQSLWARILAGEANKSGSFSKRTIDIISYLGRNEASVFSKLCCYCLEIKSGLLTFIINPQNEIYSKEGINFDILNELDSIGLINFNSVLGYKWTFTNKTAEAKYHDISFHIDVSKTQDNAINLGQVIFTRSGRQLYSIIASEKINGFTEYLLEVFKTKEVSIKAI